MIAGLPKFSPVVLTLLLIASISIGLVAQETQTESVVPEEIISLIDSNPLLDEAQREALLLSLEAAIGFDPDLITADAVAGLLDTLGWTALEDPEDLGDALELLQTVLSGASIGEITDLEGALATLLADAETPDGVLNAIGKAAADMGDEEAASLLAKATDLMVAGLPPGIVLRVTKDGIRDGLSAEVILAMLDELQTAMADGESAGNAANEVTGQGQNKHQDEEQNQNASEEEDPGTEEETESNRHGNAGGKDNAPGQEKKGEDQGGKNK